MVRALLLDLDDTLLINDFEPFYKAYREALVKRFADVLPPVKLLDALDAGTQAMMSNTGGARTNSQVFWHEFSLRTGLSRSEMEAEFESFYTDEFELLRAYTSVDPAARELVTAAKAKGYILAVATQPVFPMSAVLARLRWAKVPHECVHYDAISSYDSQSACKPHPAFFKQMLHELQVEPGEAVMVGDSRVADLAASQFGMRTFWVTRSGGNAPEADWCGDLSDLCELVSTGGFDGGR